MNDAIETGYTRAHFAAAVDEAHAALHEAGTQLGYLDTAKPHLYDATRAIKRAHEALHSVGAGLPRVGCATPDPEAQAILRDLLAARDREIPCGHTIADLILCGGKDGGEPEHMPPLTKCGACLAARNTARGDGRGGR